MRRLACLGDAGLTFGRPARGQHCCVRPGDLRSGLQVSRILVKSTESFDALSVYLLLNPRCFETSLNWEGVTHEVIGQSAYQGTVVCRYNHKELGFL